MTSFSKSSLDSPDAFSSVRTISTPTGAPNPAQPVWNTQRGTAMPVNRYRSFSDEVEQIQYPTASGRTRSSTRPPCGVRSICGTAIRR